MIDIIAEAITSLQNESSSYSEGVQIWMKVMGFSFLASLLFVRKKVAARWLLAALVLNILGLITGKVLFPNESRTMIGTYVHLIFWPPILWAVWRTCRHQSLSQHFQTRPDSFYMVWLLWACGLIVISLVFDARTLIV